MKFDCLIVAALLGLSTDAMAALGISGEALLDPPAASLLRGQTATFVLTITNTGDQPLDRAWAATDYRIGGGFGTVGIFATAATPPCIPREFYFDTAPGMPGLVAQSTEFIAAPILPTPILPGESRQCVVGLRVAADAAGPFAQAFRFSARSGAQTVDAAMPLSITFPLGPPPTSIPLSSWWSLVFFSVLILLLGVHRSPR